MNKVNEFGRRLRLVWAVAATLLAAAMGFEAHTWWLPLAASPLAYAPLFAKVRMSVRLGGAALGSGFVLVTTGISGAVESGLFFMALSVSVVLVWEVLAFLAAPFLKRNDAQQLPPR